MQTGDHHVEFNRRRYGSTAYTWAYLVIGEDRHGLGDPWPAVHWRRSALEQAIEHKLEELRPHPTTVEQLTLI